MSFLQLNSLVALLFLLLCISLVFLPGAVYWMFGLQGNEVGNFLAKRAGMLFLGLSVLCYSSRNTASKEVQNIVALSVGTAMGTVALLGLVELLRGNASMGILVAVAIEAAIATLFLRTRT